MQKNKDRALFEGSAKFTRIIYFFVSACTLKNLSKKNPPKNPKQKQEAIFKCRDRALRCNFMNITTLSRYCEAVRQKVFIYVLS